MREKEKGFTLIELLAVIVILAVISLIATPIVLNLINTSKKGAFTRSAEGVLKSAKLYYSSSLLQVSGPKDIIFTCYNNECISGIKDENEEPIKLEVSGDIGDGYVRIYGNGDVEMLVTDENYYAAKPKEGDITVDKGNGSNVDLTNDTTPPIINSVNTSVTTNSITVTVGSKDDESGIYGYEYSIDNGVTYTEIQRNNTYTFEGLTNDKEYEVRVKVYNGTYGKDTYSDEKGMSQSESKLIRLKAIDTPKITVIPEEWSFEKEITIDYKGAQIKEYSLDNGQTYVEYTGPFKVTENINLIAKASDGQNEVTKTEIISKIDRELPTVEVSDINTSYETKDEITLTLNDNLSGVTHYCITGENISDNCNWISGNGIVKYTINTNGTYYAYSKDLVGNISEGKEFVIDKIDTEEPTASLELESKTTNSITVKAVCTDNVGVTKYEYSKDNGVSYETGENETYTFSNLTTGTYNMKVRCSDEAGNSAVGNIVDTTNNLTIPTYSVSNSGNWSTSKTVTISYPEGYTNEYQIISGSATKEDGTVLTVGTWYLAGGNIEKVIFTSNGNIIARTSDGINTVTATSQNVSMIDTTVPTLTMTSKKATSGTIVNSDIWSDELLTFTLTKGTVGASGSTLYYCKDTSNSCNPRIEVESGIDFNITDTGIYYIRYKAVSGAKVESSIGTYRAKVDTTVPTLTMTSKKATSGTIINSDTWSNEVLTFALTKGAVGTSGSTLYYCKDTSNSCSPNVSVGAGISFNITDIGTYYIRYKAVSGVGKESSIGSYKAKVDTEKPRVEVSGISSAWVTSNAITLTLTDSISGVTHYCVTNESTSNNCNWISGSGSVKYTINTNGTYYAYSKDLVGNISEAKEFVIDKIDVTNPTASLTVTSKTTNSITVKAVCTDNVGITKYEYSYDNGVNYKTGTTDTYTFSNLTTGTYNMKVRCSDAAGNSMIGNIADTTNNLTIPTYTVSNSGNWSTSKTVTISYPTGYTNEYQIISGSATKEDGTTLTVGTWYQASSTQEKVIFTSNGNISARTSDGINTVTATSQTVSNIETVKPTNMTLNANSDTTYAKTKSVTVTLKDTGGSGLAAGSIKYGWSTSTSTAPSSYTTVSTSATSGTNTTTFAASGSGLTGSYYLWVVPVTYKDNAGNSNTTTVKSTGTFKFDNTAPTSVTLSANSDTTYAKTKSVTVTLKDTGGSGLAAGSIKYGWSTSTSTAPSSYTTVNTSATSGTNTTTFTASGSGLTGSYYLWVVPVTYKDNAGNSNTTTVKSTGTFKFDNTAPTSVTLSANSDTTYAKTKSVTVTLKDTGGSGLAAGSIKYGWSTSTSTAPSSYTTVSTSATSGTNTTTFIASGSGLTGSYYLWVVPVTYKDNAGNSNTTTVKSTGTFKFDNTVPTLTLGTVSKTSDVITVPYTASDSHSGINTTTCVYGTSTSYGSTGTISGSNCVMSGLSSSTTYYYKVTTTDKAGNSTYKTGSSTTVSCSTASASAYCGCLYPNYSNIYSTDSTNYNACVNKAPTISSLVVTSATSNSISVKATATNATKYEFKINSGGYINNGTTNTYTFNSLTQGSHTVYVRVTNSYGLPVSKTLAVDTTCLANAGGRCGLYGTGTYKCSVSTSGTCSCTCS